MSLWGRLTKGERAPVEQRSASRIFAPPLAAYYWDGGAPTPHEIRDISASGMYVQTPERWYRGTVVLMRLQRTDCGEGAAAESIAVMARAVRCGPDGVGLHFLLHDKNDRRSGKAPLMEGVDKATYLRFFKELRNTVNERAARNAN